MDIRAKRASSRERAAGTAAVFAVLALLAVLTVDNGSYFDDEIASIRMMDSASGLRQMIALANSNDVHPPLAYVIDHALHRLTGSWKAVQLLAGLANAAALAGFVWIAASALPRRTWLILAALAGTCATAIMWGASLRWYAWFNPVFTLTLAALLWSRLSPARSAAVLAAAAVVMLHTGYLAFVAVPVLAVLWLARRAAALDRRSLAASAATALLALAACLPQVGVLLSVHLIGQGPQRGSHVLALIQSGITLLLGNAVFPLGIVPLLALLAQIIALGLFLRRGLPGDRAGHLALAGGIALGLILLAATGLGYKPRNAVFLAIAMIPLLAAALAALPRRLAAPALAAVAALQLAGLANVALHRDTAKRSFNTPYPQLVARIADLTRGCRQAVVAHDDEVLGYLLPPGARQSRPLAGAAPPILLVPGDCVVVEQGSAFERGTPDAARWKAALESPALRRERTETFRPEPRVALAGRWLGTPVAPYAASLELRRVVRPMALPALPGTPTGPDLTAF